MKCGHGLDDCKVYYYPNRVKKVCKLCAQRQALAYKWAKKLKDYLNDNQTNRNTGN